MPPWLLHFFTGLFGHEARFAFRVSRPGFDSKSEQLTSTTIQTDPRQRTSGPVPTPWLVRSPEVPDTLSLARPADHVGARAEAFFEKRFGAAIGRPKLISKDRFGTGTSVISARNCRGAVEFVLLQTLRRSGCRPAKSGEEQTQISP